ncbi:uncharacterized protein C4orf54 homolog [Cygnus atratus]|uniref:uncharacterized protein C4orf54 homolog n=1 Tax=Cygnus atratus TaxID=8868 RepID=UPI0021B7F12C|nr:uncharacterized protein C4orf54 homolog [Cygnus atratus]
MDAASERGPGPEEAAGKGKEEEEEEEEEAAVYVEVCGSARRHGAESGARGSGDAGGGAAGRAAGAASPEGTGTPPHRPQRQDPAGCGSGSGGAAGTPGGRLEPSSSSSSSSSCCPWPGSKAGGRASAGEPAPTEGKASSSSSLGYESEGEDGAGRGEALPGRPPGAPPVGGDEAHYISTREIQLSEVDHDMDFDAGLAARWDFEDDNVIYSFVDYASFGSAETPGDTPTEEDNSCYLSTTTSEPNNPTDSADNASGAEIASSRSENDTPGGDKCDGSEASRPRRPGGPAESPAGQLLLSIKAASRAINEPSNGQEKQNAVHAAKHEGDMSLRVPTAPEREASRGQDAVHHHHHHHHHHQQQQQQAKKFIAVPARLQSGCGAVRAKEVGEYSSGASSAVSELDDADKEVRTLTARAFRSLAYPYFDALALGSRASSASLPDHALGSSRWSTYLDLKCGSLGPRAEPGLPQLCLRSGKAQPKALEFVVSKLDGEIAHVEAPPRGTSKKSQFASSLLKNVISKKMQLEHEFKMERGEISDTSSAATDRDRDRDRERPREGGVQRQSSRHSEGGSEPGVQAAEEAAEGGGGRSPASKASTPREGSRSLDRAAAEEPREARRGGSEAARATTFLRSHNSAFRTWKEREAEKKEERAPVGGLKPSPRRDPPGGRATKTSRLFVPAVQPATGPEPKEPGGPGGVSASPPAAKPRGAELQISLGGRDPPFPIAELLTPQLGGRPVEEGRGQPPKAPKGDGADRVPQFLVRDVREGKGKSQAPLHQVRDVRKLIKSSYSGDSGDNSSDKGSVASDQGGAEHKPRQLVIAGIPRALSPVVITCQALGHAGAKATDGGGKAAAAAAAGGRALGCPPEGTVLVHRTSGRLPVATIAPNKSDPRQPAVLKIVAKAGAPWRHQQPPGAADKGRGPAAAGGGGGGEEDPREEGKAAPVQNALEKLTAAVRSMEELYSFSKREWKRKSDPLPITGSHVLSLIASQERDAGPRPPPAPEPPPKAGEPPPPPKGPAPTGAERLPRRPANPAATSDKVSAKAAAFESLARQRQRGPAPPRALLALRGPTAASAAAPPPAKAPPDVGLRGPAAPRSLLRLPAAGGGGRPAGEPEHGPDCGSYLALPLKAAAGTAAPPTAASGGRPSAVSSVAAAAALRGLQPFGSAKPSGSPGGPAANTEASTAAATASPAAVEAPPAALFPPPLPPFAAPPPQLLCFSPSVPAAEPLPQRRVLLDVSSGQYYLLDAAPQQPPKRRLFDPETGQYVEVPVPTPAVAPLPLPLPPLALNAGAYGAAYMLYPGLLPAAAVLPAAALPRPLSHPGSDGSAAADPGSPAVEAEGPYFVPGGEGPATASTAASTAAAKPLISITAPAGGPRLVAPPSFDGTTMRLVVEHR